ncbi:PREDICTED: uncharacterized protein LOC104818564 [Tarenaya hassleriana]|uniref:uncharacterized protein LOC104818564 n=1 Tax=Tarenaya hassleriana TaxID=28532 RepID=UPI00053C2A1D|nr:PREDICTED: uncharacterized protein LOC104818564 [Tarenaya hassleriana]
MATSSREARRRKIIERGSDRLAFITGQIHSIPDPPPSDSPPLSESQLRTDESLLNPIPLPDQILSDEISSQQENISDGMLDNNESYRADHNVYQSKARLPQPQMSIETSANVPASEPRDTIQPSPTTSTTQTTSARDLSAHQSLLPLGHVTKVITPKHVGAAIDASEYTRVFSSLAIALLVILSCFGFSSLNVIISFRPVFLLLLTDATIVLGRVLLNHREDPSTASRRENTVTTSDQGIAEQVGNAVEMALMIKKIMNAVLMDFSVYAVILICGLLFSQDNLA